MANCRVKLLAPLVSVVVPPARASSLVKSRLLSGRLATCLLESWVLPSPGLFDGLGGCWLDPDCAPWDAGAPDEHCWPAPAFNAKDEPRRMRRTLSAKF